ncbi:hypothetical protein CEXT_254731 [Caerostris extrusa]|uniref:Uncharacterized protein n=1 Tax=Caerostris extrusa TaxID=172846 RepID=A0AAV4PYS0_CAEEX|nr:hypothetical protein CEXT_254731 [Caerostris extrusa]
MGRIERRTADGMKNVISEQIAVFGTKEWMTDRLRMGGDVFERRRWKGWKSIDKKKKEEHSIADVFE